MAGALGCNRDLWQAITVGSTLKPPEFAGNEIDRNEEKLSKGLFFYKKYGTGGKGIFKNKYKLKGPQLDFLEKLSKFLDLDEQQCYNIFLSYLLHDYRNSQKELQSILSIERHAQGLLLKIRDYYNSERLYLLRCIKNILSYWQETDHPYQVQYNNFMKKMLQDSENKFIEGIIKQYKCICEEIAPSSLTHGTLMNDRHASLWVTQNLKEQCELLEILTLFFRIIEHPAESLLDLANQFKKQHFGKRQTNKNLLDETATPLVLRIGFLQVIILIEGLDLEFLQQCDKNGKIIDHHIIKSTEYKELDSLFCSLSGDQVSHGPLLLCWTAVRYLNAKNNKVDSGVAVTRKIGNMALQLHVLQYLASLLETEPFSGDNTIAAVSNTVINGLMAMVLNIYEEDTLGDTEGLHKLVSKLLTQPYISEEFWTKDLSEGMGMVIQSAMKMFPLAFNPLLTLCTALAKSGQPSARKVMLLIQGLPLYSEYIGPQQSLTSIGCDTVELLKDNHPYGLMGGVVIPVGSTGQLKSKSDIVTWECEYNGWQVFLCEVQSLLIQISRSAGMVSNDSIDKVTQIIILMEVIMSSDPESIPKFNALTSLLPEILQRFSLSSQPPLELLSAAIEALTCVAKENPQDVWMSLQQTGFLPYMTENFDTIHEAANGAGLHAGTYGQVLAGHECSQGKYPVTLAYLKLICSLVVPFKKANVLENLTPSVVYLCREIFPVFHKWRYYDFGGREQVGQRCLEIFHRVLNIFNDTKPNILNLKDICVHCILYTDSGRSLLELLSTGVDAIELGLSLQGSTSEGIGIELIQLLRLAFSVLNRLLLLRPSDAPPSPVEHSLSAKPANYTTRHLVTIIAQYIYHRHDPRLPVLATLLLKRIAMVFPMSILACLGNDAEAIRDIYLARLQAGTEDHRLKVVILELLAVCVETQPGLTEMFLNVQPIQHGKDSKEKDMAIGRTSCLQTVLNLIEEKKQGTYHCPPDLMSAALQFIHALWHVRRETAMAALREKSNFWKCICLSITRDLPVPKSVTDLENVEHDIKSCSSIFGILAEEFYCVNSDRIDGNLKKVMDEVIEKNRLRYWSDYLLKAMVIVAENQVEEPEILSDNSTLQLLLSWRNLLLVIAVYKENTIKLKSAARDQILKNLIDGMEAQFGNMMNTLHVKLASITSAFYFTLLKKWIGDVQDKVALLAQLEQILHLTCANSETLLPSVQIGVLGAIITVLQHTRKDSKTGKLEQLMKVKPLVSIVCSVLQQSSYQLRPAGNECPIESGSELDVKLKLQITTVSLLEELVLGLDSSELWLPAMQNHTIFQCLISSMQLFCQAKQGLQYVESVITLFAALAKSKPAAEALAVNGMNRHLCLVFTQLYYDNKQTTNILKTVNKHAVQANLTDKASSWQQIYCIMVSIMADMLATLQYNYLDESLDFAGVHQDRMLKCLESVRSNLTPSCLNEALQTCRFLHKLSQFKREWRLHLPEVLSKLMISVSTLIHTCVSLLIRPKLLQHMVHHQSLGEQTISAFQNKSLTRPISRHLSTSSSLDDCETMSDESLVAQQRLLEILCHGLSTLRSFSPNLCEILLDQGMDIEEYEPILTHLFATPNMDQVSTATFGTMVSLMNRCQSLLSMVDPHAVSPQKSPRSDLPIKKSTIVFVLENAVYLIMSQAVRFLREPALPLRDKQFLRRELSDELTSFLKSMQRHIRRGGPPSPAPGSSSSPQHSLKPSHSSSSFTQEQFDFFKLIENFLQNVLR